MFFSGKDFLKVWLKQSRDCEISNPSAIKYALDNEKPSIKRRSDKKIFFIRELN